MPEFHCFLGKEDISRVVQVFLDEGCWLIPHGNFKKNEAIEVRDVETFHHVMYNNSLNIITQWFVISKEFTFFPPVVKSFYSEKNKCTVYYKSDVMGGATLHLYVDPLENSEKGGKYLPDSWITHDPCYWHPHREEKIRVPDRVKEIYKLACKEVRKGGCVTKIAQFKYHIGASTIQDLCLGKYKLLKLFEDEETLYIPLEVEEKWAKLLAKEKKEQERNLKKKTKRKRLN